MRWSRGRGGAGGPIQGVCLISPKNIGFLSNTGPDPLKNQASIQCWAIISPPAKRNLTLLVIFWSSLPWSTKNKTKKTSELDPLWQKFWIPTWFIWYMFASVTDTREGINSSYASAVCWSYLQTVWTQIRTNKMWGLIRIQTVWHSDSIPEINLRKNFF